MTAARGARRGDDVVVTGAGAVTPHGLGVDALWQGVLGGHAVAETVEVGDGTGAVVTRVRDVDPAAQLPRKLAAQTDRGVQLGLLAAAEALGDADLLDGHGQVAGVDPSRCGVVMATGVGPVLSVTAEQQRADEDRRVRPYLAITMPVNMAAGQLARRHGLHGPSLVVASACAAGTDAIGHARDLIRLDRADVVVAGGAEAPIAGVTLAAFRAAGALSGRTDEPGRASRPFDVDRDGFVLGEGAGVLVLERRASADARGAQVLGTVAGWGATNDAYHPTQPEPSGRGAAAAVRAALADAGLDPGAVGHVNAHATSTPRNDEVEARVLREVFGDRVGTVPVTATKSTIGHLFGAAGAVEAIVALRAAATGVVPPITNLCDVDPECGGPELVRDAPGTATSPIALSTSLGFGGHNAALVLEGGPSIV